jgi:hypothetical protein
MQTYPWYQWGLIILLIVIIIFILAVRIWYRPKIVKENFEPEKIEKHALDRIFCRIRNPRTGMVAHIPEIMAGTPGSEVIQWWPTGDFAQLWFITPEKHKSFAIRNFYSGMALTAKSKDDGTDHIIIWPFHSGAEQLWYLVPVNSSENYHLVNSLTGTLLTMKGKTLGTPLTGTSSDGSSQNLKIEPVPIKQVFSH